MEYRPMVYRQKKSSPPAEVGLPFIVFLQNLARPEEQQNQDDWQRKIQKKRTS